MAALFEGKLCKSHNSLNVFFGQSEHSCCLAPQHLAILLTHSHPSWPSRTLLCVYNSGGGGCFLCTFLESKVYHGMVLCAFVEKYTDIGCVLQ